MAGRVLHVLDATTPGDALDVLALVLARQEHRLAGLGHRSTERLAARAGIRDPITFVQAVGWADPTGWRALQRLIRDFQPTHVHAWGIPAALAVTLARFKGKRLVTLADMPRTGHLRLLQFIHKGGLWVSVSPCHWTVTTTWLKRELHTQGIAADAVTLIRPAVCAGERPGINGLREELGLRAGDGPIVLLGGEGAPGTLLTPPGMDPVAQGGRSGPRNDLGIWAAGLLQVLFPHIRVLVREDPRGLTNPGLERMLDKLPDNELAVVAPAEHSWRDLLGVADLLLATPDGPFAAGSIVQAFGAEVPVIGTPVDAVREHITDGHNGMLTPGMRPREIAATVERFWGQPELQEKFTKQALADARARHDVGALVRGFEGLYE
jgi:glycosyltransferase involved in cell wall biosynthesis